MSWVARLDRVRGGAVEENARMGIELFDFEGIGVGERGIDGGREREKVL